MRCADVDVLLCMTAPVSVILHSSMNILVFPMCAAFEDCRRSNWDLSCLSIIQLSITCIIYQR